MEDGDYSWPDDPNECAALARSMLITECVSNAQYWLTWGAHFVTHPQPDQPYLRDWSAVVKEGRAFREVFATLNEDQRKKVIELLERCINGVVHSVLCTFDQFPHGEAEILVREGVCGSGTRSFRIAPTIEDLHDDFSAASHDAKTLANGEDA